MGNINKPTRGGKSPRGRKPEQIKALGADWKDALKHALGKPIPAKVKKKKK